MDSLPIEVVFDVSEQAASGFVSGRPSLLADECHLRGEEETFHGRTVVAPSRPAHG